MITEQMKADGWIEHDGGACPVARDAIVSSLARSGKVRDRHSATYLDWWHTGHPADIIAYKSEQPQ